MSDRNAEIWSTRLQREILALESSDDESKKIELLPPFIKTIGHTLSIEGGIAKIEFRIDVEVPENAAGGGEEEEEVVDSAATSGEETSVQSVGEKKVDGEDSTEENAVAIDKKEGGDIAQKDESMGDEKDTDTDGTESKDTTKTEDGSPQEKAEEKADPHVVLVLDASLYWRPDSASSSQSTSPQCYPFQKPLAIVKYGSNLFSGGSTIQNGDEVDIDLDWTPSIHLSDAVTNVALKIRECIKRGEPLHATVKEDNDDDGFSGSLLREAREAKESLLETKKAAVAIFSSGLSSLSAKGSSFAAKGESASKRMSKGILNLGESLSTIAAPTMQGEDTLEETEVAAGGEEGSAKEESNIKVVKEIPDIGDEIDLSDDPWNKCIGMYSCKAIKRPQFIEALLSNSATNQKEVSGSMFSRFAKSAKSAMEETFLMITDKCIVEFKSSRLNIGSGTVTFAIAIDQMAKLKFRREESLSLFFKPASNDPLVYMCLDSALAVQDIQNVLKSHGVKGKHTNAATQRSVQMALNLVALIQQKEKELIDSPTVDRVNEIMDLYRQAAEKFEVAGDPRHTEVMAHMKRFLNQQFTTSILDGTFAKTIEQTTVTNSNTAQDEKKVPDGEILEAPTYNLSNDDDDDDDDDHGAADPVEDKGDTPTKDAPDDLNDSTLQNMEDMLNEAVKDMKDVGMEDDDINDILTSPPKQSTGEGKDDIAEHDDTFAELDAMLSDADAELNELLNS